MWKSNKLLILTISIIVALFVLLILGAVFMGASISVVEERLYKWLQLLFLGIITFGILRLYNAVTVNSGYTSKLSKEINILIAQLKTSERTLVNESRDSKSTSNALKHALEKMGATISLLITKLK